MTKVYVVTSGSYSDYGIERIFSAREHAEEYIALRPFNYDDAQIEEFVIDSSEPVVQWNVNMLRDGSLLNREPPRVSLNSCHGTQHSFPRTFMSIMSGDVTHPYIHVNTSKAADAQHAVKIANEIRARLIANNEWPAET